MFSFDPTTYEEESNSFEALPTGWYPVMIVESEDTETRAGDGRLLKLVLKVIEGKYTGRKIFANIVYEHPNEDTVNIAKARSGELCKICGITKAISSPSVFHGVPMEARIRYVPENEKYDATNDVQRYRPLRGQSGSTPANPGSINMPSKKAATPPKKSSPPVKSDTDYSAPQPWENDDSDESTESDGPPPWGS